MTKAVRRFVRAGVRLVRNAWLLLGITLLLIFVVEGGLSLVSLVYHHLSARPTSANLNRRADAYPDSAWVNDYYGELDTMSAQWRPYVYWRTAPHTGKYINIDADGYRFDPAAEVRTTGPGPVLRIFMFGGLTLWGMGARDAFTIPALLNRELRRKGVVADVTNFGEFGYVTTQEVITLLLQLRNGNIPDLVIFYDGINDVESAFQQGVAGIPENEAHRVEEFNLSNPDRTKQLSRLFLRTQLQQLANRSHVVAVLRNVARALGISRREVSSDTSAVARGSSSDALLAEQVVDRYRGNLELVTVLAAHYGFNCLFYWQPTIYRKTNLTEFERTLLKVRWVAPLGRFTLTVDSVVRANMPALRSHYQLHDVSDVFLPTTAPIYVNPYHLSESGNGRIAEIMTNDILTLLSGRRVGGVAERPSNFHAP